MPEPQALLYIRTALNVDNFANCQDWETAQKEMGLLVPWKLRSVSGQRDGLGLSLSPGDSLARKESRSIGGGSFSR
jgi:hypothetical protein